MASNTNTNMNISSNDKCLNTVMDTITDVVAASLIITVSTTTTESTSSTAIAPMD